MSRRSRVEPFDEGAAAAEAGMGEDGNPYKVGTEDHILWLAGFVQALSMDEDDTDADEEVSEGAS